MSLLRASLRLLPLLVLSAACTGKRADPEPGSGTQVIITGSGGAGGGASNGGAPNGGAPSGGAPSGGAPNGGAPSTGGMGGTPATGGAPGTGGGTFNDVSALYPFCGCLDDSKDPGACQNCFNTAQLDASCNPAGACAAGCVAIINFLKNDPSCVFVDEACLQGAFAQAPSEWDDAVDKIKCTCDLCPAPFGCESVSCK